MAYDNQYFWMIQDSSGKNGFAVWGLRTVDALAAVTGAGYISDAQDRRVRVGDIVKAQRVTAGTLSAPTTLQTTEFSVTALTSSGAGTLSVLSAIT